MRDLGIEVPQVVEQIEQRALVLELVECGESREFDNVHLSRHQMQRFPQRALCMLRTQKEKAATLAALSHSDSTP